MGNRKYIYIILGFQSSRSKSWCNVRRLQYHGCCWKHWIETRSTFKVDFQSIYFYINYLNLIVISTGCIIASLIGLHWFASYFESLFSKKKNLCSLEKTISGLKIDFEMGFSILCFQRCLQQRSLCLLHCEVKHFACNNKYPERRPQS